jgi:hypothetical protein
LDASLVDKRGITALCLACGTPDVELVFAILRYAEDPNINAKISFGGTVEEFSSLFRFFPVSVFIPRFFLSLFCFCCCSVIVVVVVSFVSSNLLSRSGNTALHYLASKLPPRFIPFDPSARLFHVNSTTGETDPLPDEPQTLARLILMMLHRGADAMIVNDQGLSPTDMHFAIGQWSEYVLRNPLPLSERKQLFFYDRTKIMMREADQALKKKKVAVTPYALFCFDKKEQLRATEPDLTKDQLNRIIASTKLYATWYDDWNKLSLVDRETYLDKCHAHNSSL